MLLRETPAVLELFEVKALSCVTLDGIETPTDAPPKTRFEKLVVIRFVGVPPMAGPFRVNVFGEAALIPPTS